MKRKTWKIKEVDPRIKELSEKHKITPFFIQVLLNRNIAEDAFKSFLKAGPESFHCPTLLPDIQKAKGRVADAISKKEKVLVFGDYDVDGITSLAIFNEFAKKYPDVFSFYIPHRIEEGYGLSKQAILKAKEESVSLIITFDCGTNAYEEIELATSLKIDIIVIDHHHPQENLTNVFAFVNPKQEKSMYPFCNLSTGALSYKFLQVLTGSDCCEVLDLVALSLVCDVVPLKGENRSLLKEGLKAIKKSPRFAIKALCKAGSIRQENIDTFHIGYILGPRINASGRVAHAKDSLELFLVNSQEEADSIALKLGQYNQLRKSIETQILKEADERVNSSLKLSSAIVVSGQNWHPGVLGIVASRLADKYNRPSFVISFDENIGKGSARSIDGIHLIEMLDECADSLLLYGGHGKAAGVEISKDDLESFRERINSIIDENLSPEDFIPSIDIDAALNFKDINMAFIEELELLSPYGEGNRKPLFCAYNISKKSRPKKLRTGFTIWLSDKRKIFEALIFDKDILEVIEYAEEFDIAFSLDRNTYHNIPKLIVRDCRLSGVEC